MYKRITYAIGNISLGNWLTLGNIYRYITSYMGEKKILKN